METSINDVVDTDSDNMDIDDRVTCPDCGQEFDSYYYVKYHIAESCKVAA